MIISEKQILHLLDLAKFIIFDPSSSNEFKTQVLELVNEIENQQSEELRSYTDEY